MLRPQLPFPPQQQLRLGPGAPGGAGGGGGAATRGRRGPSPARASNPRPPAARAPARAAPSSKLWRLPPARVRTCCCFCARPRSLTCPRAAAGCLAHSRVSSLTRRELSGCQPRSQGSVLAPGEFRGAAARPPALVHATLAAPRSPETPQFRGRVRTASEVPPLGAASAPRKVHETLQGADPGEDPATAAQGRGRRPVFSRDPAAGTAGRGCLPCPRPHAPVPAVPSPSRISHYCQWRKKT